MAWLGNRAIRLTRERPGALCQALLLISALTISATVAAANPQAPIAADTHPRAVTPASAAALSILLSAAAAAAAPAAATDAPADRSAALPPAAPAKPSFAAQVIDRLAPLLAAGMRVREVALGCTPPPEAVIDRVAPGMTQIQSRGFVVEFHSAERKLVCSATMTAQRQVLVAAHDITPNQAVSNSDFKPQWVDAFTDAGGALTALAGDGFYCGASPIRAGQPLYANAITRPPAVRAGDLVTVVVRDGAVTVRTQLLAQSSAAIGENATLLNPASGTAVAAVVTGPRAAALVIQ
jgi:flagella basal body P-ring formation protein FlgA